MPKAGKAKKESPPAARPKGLGTWICILICLIGELFFYTWCRMECLHVGYDIGVVTQDQQRLVALQSNLNIELSRLKSPQRVARIAREQLNLTMPTPEQIIVIR